LLLDRGTLTTQLRVSSALSGLGIENWQTPKGLKDPGEFDKHTFADFALAVNRRRT